MADPGIPPPPPPPPPPGDLLGDSISMPPSISSGNASMTPSQSGSSLQSASGSEAASVNGNGSPGKRPATIDEVRQSARKWSLAGDAGVLLYLRQFSQNMILKTHELEKAVDSLAYETKGLDSKVHNTFNDFLMLSNKQFIENRVYDEEVSQEETADKESQQQQNKSREQLEAEILPRFSQAVNLGFQVLEDAFITVELKPSEESDDEDEESLPAGYVPDPIIEPKDMYISRPLPHLIGTAEFFSDDTLGLIEYDEEEGEKKKDEEESDESETSESEEESESEYSETSEEDEIKKPSKKRISESSESEDESESDEDLFAEKTRKEVHSSDETDESEDEEISQQKPKNAIQAELAAKLGLQGQVPKASIQEDKDDKSDTQSITSKKSTTDTKSIASTAEAANVAAGPKIKKEVKHRSSSKRSEGGHKKHKGSVKHHHHHHKSKDEQEDLESDDDLFGEPRKKEENFEDESPFGKKGGMFSGGGTLFGTEPESDLFGEIENDNAPSQSTETPQEPETPTEVKPRTRTTSSGKKLPAGAVSLFGGANLFGGGDDTKDHTITEEEIEDVKGTKKPPPIVKGLFGDDDGSDLFNSKPKQNYLEEPPKQKRKKTLEFFDDKEDSLFGNDDKKSTEKSATEPKNVQTKTPTEKTGGLFTAAADNETTQPKSKADEKKATTKPKVLSLFDDDDAEEEDWFDSMNSNKNQAPIIQPKDDKKSEIPKQTSSLFTDSQPKEAKVQAEKPAQAKKPSKSKKVVSLFDDEEDELFGSTSSLPPITKSAASKKKAAVEENLPEKTEKEVEQNNAEKGNENKIIKEKKSDSLNVKSKSKSQRPRSFIDDDNNGLFGDDQDDLFTAPSKKPPAQTESAAAKKKPKKSGVSFLDGDDDDDDNDFFGVSSQSATNQEAKTEPKQTEKSEEKWKVEMSANQETTRQNSDEQKKANKTEPKGIFGDDVDEDVDLFQDIGSSNEKKGSDVQTSREPEQSATADGNEIDTKQKPKKLAGAVSLFGGINPLAAKKNLRSASKEEAKSPVKDIVGDNDLFSNTSSKQNTQPAAAQAPAPSHSSKVEEEEVRPPKEATDGPKKEDARKIPKIVFDPATLVPGAKPPQRLVEPPPVSFDDPAPVQTLTNPNKDRAKIQKKRRPPSRQLRQGQISTEQNAATAINVPGTILENKSTAHATKAATPTVEHKQEVKRSITATEKPSEEKNRKALKAEDIFSDDDDDLFSPKKTSSSAKKEDKKPRNFSEESITTNKQLPDNDIVTKTVEKEKKDHADLFLENTNDGDDMFSVKKDLASTERKQEGDVGEVEDDNSVKIKENVKSEMIEGIAPSRSKDLKEKEAKYGKDSEEEDLFKSPEKKEKATVEVNKEIEEGKEKEEEEVVKVKKKKKEKANIFDQEAEDDLFGNKSKKKEDKPEGAKKTKKASKIVTDEDLFGEHDSIFDVPSKTKEKKKKKGDSGKDILNSKEDDIFASGGSEKKTKTKKKTDKVAKSKTSKKQINETDSTPNIFEDPLNALGGD